MALRVSRGLRTAIMDSVSKSTIPSLTRAPVQTGAPDAEQAWRAHTLKVILSTFSGLLFVNLAVGVPLVFANKPGAVVVIAVMALATACAWGCLRSGRVTAGVHVLVWTLWTFSAVVSFLAVYPSAIWLTPAVFIAAALLGPAWAIALGVSGIALTAVAIHAVDFGWQLHPIFPAPPISQLFQFAGLLVLTVVPFYLVVRRMTAALHRAGEELSERSNAQQELRHSENRLTLALEAARTGIWEWHIASGRLTVTPQAEAVVGLNAGEFGGTYEDFLRLIHPDDVDRVAEFNLGVLEGRMRGRAIEHRIVIRADSIRWIEGRGTLQRDAEGRPESVIGTVVDVTPRKLAEQALRESEDLYRSMIGTMAEGVMLRDMEGQLLLCNPAAERIIGLTAQEMGRWSFPLDGWRTIHEDGTPFPLDDHPVMTTLRTGRPFAGVVMGIERGDDPVTWISVNSVALQREGEQRPYAVLTTLFDITQRKNAERALVDSERRYRTILDTLTEGVIMRGPQREVLIANPAAERILGVRPERLHYEELRERGWRTCREDGSPFPESEFPFEVALRTGRSQFDVIMGIRRPDRSLTWVSINAQPVFEPGATKPYAVVVSHADITARKLSEEALRASEERFSKAFRATPAFVTISKLDDGRYIDVNEEFERATGHHRDDVIGRTSLDINLWVDPAERRHMVEILEREKRVNRLEINLRRKSGEMMYCELSAEVLEFEGVPCMLAVTNDVTERRRSQQMLESERMLLRTLVDNLPDDIFVIDTAGRYTMVNAAWLAQVSFSTSDDVLGKTVFDFFDAELAARFDTENRRVIESGIGLYNQSRPIEKSSGGKRWILTSKIPMRDADGRITGIVGINRDVTELNNALDNLQLERNLLRSIIDTVPDAILVKDRECRYVIMNKESLQLRGVTAHDEIVGKSARDYLPEAAAREHEEEDRRVMIGGAPLINVRRQPSLTGTGRRWVSSSKVPLRGADGTVNGMVEVNRDITDLQNIIEQVHSLNAELENRVRLRTEELQEANKELEAFSYSVSHDLRAPLRSILGFGNFMLQDNFEQLDAEGKARLQRILAASARMGELIDDLLKLARISRQSMLPRKVNLHTLAAEIAARLADASPERRVEVVIAPDLAVNGDTGLLRVVLENLLGNAWKFTGKRADARIELGVASVDGKRTYYVRDNGAGFDMSYAGKLFAPFQRMHTQQQFEGTGIGLATVKRIIDRHQGRVWIESGVDRGTTVFFTIGAAA